MKGVTFYLFRQKVVRLYQFLKFQVLDLYSQTDANNPPDSPPLSPQKALQPPIISLKNTNGQEKPASPEQPPPVNVKIPPPSDIPQFPYSTFTGSHTVPGYGAAFPSTMAPPPTVTAPPPHITGPPPGPPPHITAPPPTVFPPYVNHPPPFPPVVPPAAPPFFSTSAPPPAQPHRPYYPPPT